MYKGLAFIAYSVKDVPRALAFYRDVVGFTPGQSFGDHWAEFDVGDATFGIGNVESIGVPAGSQRAAAFEVADIVAEQARLRSNGVEVSDIHEFPACRACSVTDPDGNRFWLHQRSG